MSRYAFTLLCSILLMQGGCTNPASMQATRLDSVRAGMTRDEVLEILGPPQRQEVYGSTEFLIYSSDGMSTTALLDFIPIAVADGRVTGTGRKLYDAVVHAHTRYGTER
jgi:hypothetical protein